MKLPTSYLPTKIRSAVRFLIVGTTGAIVQTWFFMAALYFLSSPEKGTGLYYVAFGIGYLLEMVPNYLFSNWYTFGTRPNKKNAGGFLFARVINVIVQFGLLPLALAFFYILARRLNQLVGHLHRWLHQLSDMFIVFQKT